jgi:hypothetical protein
MTIKQGEIWVALRSICEASLQSVGEKVVAAWPHIDFQSGDCSNPAFPIGLWGSFTNSLRGDIEGVDISVDFKWGNQVVEVIADVAYESGEILSEWPVQFIPLADDGSLIEDIAREVAIKVSGYLQGQWELVGKALLA